MFLNFLNALSEVTSGTCMNREVAAMMASGVLIALSCLISIAISLISGIRSMITHSRNNDLRLFFSANDNLGQPKSSISEIMEIMAVPSRKSSVLGLPSCTLIRKFVSATKLNPFISYLFLVGHCIQSTFELPEMFSKGFLFAFFGNQYKRFSYFFLSHRFFDFNYHNPKIKKGIDSLKKANS